MKKHILPVFMILLVLSSCKKDDFQPGSAVQGEWVLVKSESSWTSAVREGEELEWNETYVFNDDNTFIKTRETDEGSFQASGKYSLKEAEGTDPSKARLYLTLTFQSGDEIFGTCTSTLMIEELIITQQGELKNTWGACDGPYLYYEKR